jgi:predicted HTH transcriptional regulator
MHPHPTPAPAPRQRSLGLTLCQLAVPALAIPSVIGVAKFFTVADGAVGWTAQGIIAATGFELMNVGLSVLDIRHPALHPVVQRVRFWSVTTAIAMNTIAHYAVAVRFNVSYHEAGTMPQHLRGSTAMTRPTVELQPVVGATFNDLNESLVRDHITTAVRRRAYRDSTDPQAYLLRHRCLVEEEGRITPTVLGILAFARDPNIWLPHAGIDVVQFASPLPNSTKMLLSRQVRGDVVSLIDQTAELLWARTEHRIALHGTRRVEQDAYPLVVLRELTANAVLHRDWGMTGARIRIQILPDRIEWISPGGFPGRRKTISFETLLNEHELRNHHLAQLLYLSERLEAFGLGYDSVAEAMRDAPRTPVVTSNADRFTICVWGKLFNKEGAENSTPPALNERQQQIIALLANPAMQSAQALAEALGETTRTIQRDLRVLLDTGFIIADGNTRNRRYRAVEDTDYAE